jgi:hypothetical protein
VLVLVLLVLVLVLLPSPMVSAVSSLQCAAS